jgi:hypothetical protein
MAFTLQSATRLLTPAKTVPDQETKIKHQNNSTRPWLGRSAWSAYLISICLKCGGEDKVIACIEDQVVIDEILQHLQAKGVLPPPAELLPVARASPQADWLNRPLFRWWIFATAIMIT